MVLTQRPSPPSLSGYTFKLILSYICRSALGGDFKSALTVVALEEAIK